MLRKCQLLGVFSVETRADVQSTCGGDQLRKCQLLGVFSVKTRADVQRICGINLLRKDRKTLKEREIILYIKIDF